MAEAEPRFHITWVVVPIGLCLWIGVHWGGLLAYVLGIVGAVLCYKISRNEKWQENKRITLCVVVVALSHGIIGGVTGGMAFAKAHKEATAPVVNLDDEAERKRVFEMAMQYKARVEQGHKDVTEALKTGAKNYTMLKRRLESNEKAHAEHQAFTANFYDLSEDELRAVVNEGIAEDWGY